MKDEVRANVPCVQCFYDLCGLPQGGTCPECGQPIAPSLAPSRLVFADARWRRDVTRALERLYWVLPAMALAVVVLAVIFWPYVSSGKGAGVVVHHIFASIALALGSLIAVAACLQATAGEPAAHAESGRAPGHWLARVGAVGCWVTMMPIMLLPQIGVRLPSQISQLVLGAVFVFLCLAAIGLLGRLRQLAIRLPDPPLARGLRRDMVIIAVAGAVIAVLSGMRLPTEEGLQGLRLIAGLIILGGVWGYVWRFRRSQRRLAPLPTARDLC